MIRFALIAASVLGFALTAALGNLMVPMLRELERGPADPDGPQHVPTMGGLCLMVGTLAAVGVGWVAACIAQPQLLGGQDRMMSRLLIGLFGPLAFGVIGLADDLARMRSRSPLGLRCAARRRRFCPDCCWWRWQSAGALRTERTVRSAGRHLSPCWV